MNIRMYEHFPLKFRESNKSSVYLNGSEWKTTNAGYVTVLGQDGTPTKDKFGRLMYRRFIIQFLDGTKLSVDCSALSRGDVANPNRPSVYERGFTGIGNNLAQKDGKPTKEYTLWIAMFVRCYDPQTWVEHPTYKGCEVDERWWNFQVFCEDIGGLKGYYEWKKDKNKRNL